MQGALPSSPWVNFRPSSCQGKLQQGQGRLLVSLAPPISVTPLGFCTFPEAGREVLKGDQAAESEEEARLLLVSHRVPPSPLPNPS